MVAKSLFQRFLTNPDFGEPQREMQGFIAASYSLGAILSLPFVPIINERFGRRWAIAIGSVIMVIGSIIQCFAQNSECPVQALAIGH